MEISPACIDVTVERLHAETGKEAIRDGEGTTFAAVKAGRLGADAPADAA